MMTRPGRVALAVVLLLTAGSAAAQQTIYVDGTTDNDDWDDGTCGPRRRSKPGWTLPVTVARSSVADGTYIGPRNKDFGCGNQAMTVESAVPDL